MPLGSAAAEAEAEAEPEAEGLAAGAEPPDEADGVAFEFPFDPEQAARMKPRAVKGATTLDTFFVFIALISPIHLS
ncbi:hypothetical protein J19TS2_09470 [Cohnella xylanilytica]|nr:hypothetical protein J19TS2_09470 [Cohnella xylanilytica]